MSKNLSISLEKFLSVHHDGRSPILLALSGGPDSLALFFLLEEARQKRDFVLEVVHVDHGWREESKQEAQALSLLSARYGFPFHLHVLPPDGEEGNREERAREGRLAFFAQIVRERGAQAICLGHQRDDQAETVLKRLFEGASLPSCHGMEPSSRRRELLLWRPLLFFPKEELLLFLKKRGEGYFQDSSNFDPRYTRVRLREQVLPLLEKEFGKKVRDNLVHLAEDAGELSSFLEESLSPYLAEGKEEGEWFSLDLRPHMPLPTFLLKALLKRVVERKTGETLSRSMVRQITDAIGMGTGEALFFWKGQEVKAKRSVLEIKRIKDDKAK